MSIGIRRFLYGRLLPLGVSGALLAYLYRSVDGDRLGQLVRDSDPLGLCVAVLLTAVTVALSVARLRRLVSPFARLGKIEATSQILMACTLNLVLPSKLGDLAKAVFIRRRGVPGETAFALVTLEKLADLLALLFVGGSALVVYSASFPRARLVGALLLSAALAGLIAIAWGSFVSKILSRLGPRGRALASGWNSVRREVGARPRLALAFAGESLLLWFLHLFQVWVFVGAIGGQLPLGVHLASCSVALLAGLLPFTFAGVGTRDGAIFVLYAGYLAPTQLAAVGAFCSFRYLLPAIAGLPFALSIGASRDPEVESTRPAPSSRAPAG